MSLPGFRVRRSVGGEHQEKRPVCLLRTREVKPDIVANRVARGLFIVQHPDVLIPLQASAPCAFEEISK